MPSSVKRISSEASLPHQLHIQDDGPSYEKCNNLTSSKNNTNSTSSLRRPRGSNLSIISKLSSGSIMGSSPSAVPSNTNASNSNSNVTYNTTALTNNNFSRSSLRSGVRLRTATPKNKKPSVAFQIEPVSEDGEERNPQNLSSNGSLHLTTSDMPSSGFVNLDSANSSAPSVISPGFSSPPQKRQNVSGILKKNTSSGSLLSFVTKSHNNSVRNTPNTTPKITHSRSNSSSSHLLIRGNTNSIGSGCQQPNSRGGSQRGNNEIGTPTSRGNRNSIRSWFGGLYSREDTKSISSLQLQSLPTPMARNSHRYGSFELVSDNDGFDNESLRRDSLKSFSLAQSLRKSVEGFLGYVSYGGKAAVEQTKEDTKKSTSNQNRAANNNPHPVILINSEKPERINNSNSGQLQKKSNYSSGFSFGKKGKKNGSNNSLHAHMEELDDAIGLKTATSTSVKPWTADPSDKKHFYRKSNTLSIQIDQEDSDCEENYGGALINKETNGNSTNSPTGSNSSSPLNKDKMKKYLIVTGITVSVLTVATILLCVFLLAGSRENNNLSYGDSFSNGEFMKRDNATQTILGSDKTLVKKNDGDEENNSNTACYWITGSSVCCVVTCSVVIAGCCIKKDSADLPGDKKAAMCSCCCAEDTNDAEENSSDIPLAEVDEYESNVVVNKLG